MKTLKYFGAPLFGMLGIFALGGNLSLAAENLYSSASLGAEVFNFEGSGADRAGNGGDVVVCQGADGAMTSIELLDHYESRTLGNVTVDFQTFGSTPAEMVKSILERLAQIDPVRAELYWKEAQKFLAHIKLAQTNESEVVLLTDQHQLIDIPDSQHVILPKGCEIRQIAIRLNDPIWPKRELVIDKELWNALDAQGQAGLLMHEIVYGEAFRHKHLNSIRVRYFNVMITRPQLINPDLEFDLDLISTKKYVEMLKKVQLPYLVSGLSAGGIRADQIGELDPATIKTDVSPHWDIVRGTLLKDFMTCSYWQKVTDCYRFQAGTELVFSDDSIASATVKEFNPLHKNHYGFQIEPGTKADFWPSLSPDDTRTRRWMYDFLKFPPKTEAHSKRNNGYFHLGILKSGVVQKNAKPELPVAILYPYNVPEHGIYRPQGGERVYLDQKSPYHIVAAGNIEEDAWKRLVGENSQTRISKKYKFKHLELSGKKVPGMTMAFFDVRERRLQVSPEQWAGSVDCFDQRNGRYEYNHGCIPQNGTFWENSIQNIHIRLGYHFEDTETVRLMFYGITRINGQLAFMAGQFTPEGKGDAMITGVFYPVDQFLKTDFDENFENYLPQILGQNAIGSFILD